MEIKRLRGLSKFEDYMLHQLDKDIEAIDKFDASKFKQSEEIIDNTMSTKTLKLESSPSQHSPILHSPKPNVLIKEESLASVLIAPKITPIVTKNYMYRERRTIDA